ncbi:MAG: DUF1080 domain-containing protein, partial [Algoriphagus sp.]
MNYKTIQRLSLSLALIGVVSLAQAQTGVGAKPEKGAKVYLDGSKKSLDKNWEYWEGPRFSAENPIKWP